MPKQTVPVGCIAGRFISESKNRFRCIVEINGAKNLCYVASSCRLENFIDLAGKDVLVSPTKGKCANAKYTLVGVKHKRNYILLNSSFANYAVANSIRKRCFSCLGSRANMMKEHMICGYKSDLFFPETNSIIEIKSIISTDDQAVFGGVHSERLFQQLSKIEMLLDEGYIVRLFIVALNPDTKSVKLPKGDELAAMLARCSAKGLAISAYTCKLGTDGKVFIRNQIPVET